MHCRYFTFLIGILIFALATVVVCHRYGVGSRSFGVMKKVGAESVEAVEVSRPQDAFRHWTGRYHGRVVLFLDNDWPRFDATSYYSPPLYRKYPFKVFNLAKEQEREHLSDLNFLYFAALHGIVRDIRAVISEQGLADVAARAASGNNSRIVAGKIFSTHHGLPRTFTTLTELRAPEEPVLIYVSAAFFRYNEPAALFGRLADLGIVTDNVLACSGLGDPSVSEGERGKLKTFVRLLGRRS